MNIDKEDGFEIGIGQEELNEPQETYGAFRNFKDLNCWKACREVRLWFMVEVRTFPNEEKFALVSQVKRAARSTTANIAEGYGRFHYRENIQFCRITRGSLFELIDHLSVALDEEHITIEKHDEGLELVNNAIGLMNGYIKYLQNQIGKHQ